MCKKYINRGENGYVFFFRNVINVAQRVLYDVRDNNAYTIRKLADGNCWMTENLRLGKPGETITLTPSDSDVTNDYTIDGSEIINTSGDNWDSTPNASHAYYRSDHALGSLYNWHTATAGTGTTSASTGESFSNSICPKAWNLSSITGNGTLNYLVNTIYGANLTTLRYFPLSFEYSGYYSRGTIWTTGGGSMQYSNYGAYWTNTFYRSGSLYAYWYGYSTAYLVTTDYTTVYQGHSIRCVAI